MVKLVSSRSSISAIVRFLWGLCWTHLKRHSYKSTIKYVDKDTKQAFFKINRMTNLCKTLQIKSYHSHTGRRYGDHLVLASAHWIFLNKLIANFSTREYVKIRQTLHRRPSHRWDHRIDVFEQLIHFGRYHIWVILGVIHCIHQDYIHQQQFLWERGWVELTRRRSSQCAMRW